MAGHDRKANGSEEELQSHVEWIGRQYFEHGKEACIGEMQLQGEAVAGKSSYREKRKRRK